MKKTWIILGALAAAVILIVLLVVFIGPKTSQAPVVPPDESAVIPDLTMPDDLFTYEGEHTLTPSGETTCKSYRNAIIANPGSPDPKLIYQKALREKVCDPEIFSELMLLYINERNLNALKEISPNIKIISTRGNHIVFEGSYQGIVHTIAIDKNLTPDGSCAGDYVSTNNLRRYSCNPEIKVDTFKIPVISSEIKYLTTTSANNSKVDKMVATLTNGITNSFYNEIQRKQYPSFPPDELDEYGDALAKIADKNCVVPKYKGQALVEQGSNAGGCSDYSWQGSKEYYKVLDYTMRKSLLMLLTNPSCGKDYVGNRILATAAQSAPFDRVEFARSLSCASGFTLEEGEWGPF